jgi:hypothetical protein
MTKKLFQVLKKPAIMNITYRMSIPINIQTERLENSIKMQIYQYKCISGKEYVYHVGE